MGQAMSKSRSWDVMVWESITKMREDFYRTIDSLQKIEELHKQTILKLGKTMGIHACEVCQTRYPCDTVLLAKGFSREL